MEKLLSLWQVINGFVHRQNPWIGIVLFLISTLFAPLYLAVGDAGVLGYRHSIIKIFDSKSAGTLRIVDDSGRAIENDVYAVETTLKNAGNLAFDENRIRRPLLIKFPKGKVVQTSVSASADPDVTRFSTHITQRNANEPEAVVVNWAHFDPDQYVTITTLVASQEAVAPDVEGSLLGVKIAEGRKNEGAAQYVWTAFSIVLVTLISGVFAYVSLAGSIALFRARRFTKGVLFGLTGIALVGLTSLCAAGFYLYLSAPTVP